MAAHFLFDSAQLGTLLLRNRASGSVPNARTAAHYGQKSASARLSISEGTPISQQGLGYTDSPGWSIKKDSYSHL